MDKEQSLQKKGGYMIWTAHSIFGCLLPTWENTHINSHKQHAIFANKCTDVDDGIFGHLWWTV